MIEAGYSEYLPTIDGSVNRLSLVLPSLFDSGWSYSEIYGQAHTVSQPVQLHKMLNSRKMKVQSLLVTRVNFKMARNAKISTCSVDDSFVTDCSMPTRLSTSKNI